jgi:hypothetical protein
LFLTTLDGKLICLGGEGQALPTAPEPGLTPLDISIHPAPPTPEAPPAKAKPKSKSRTKVATPTAPLVNSEFAEVAGANVTASELGYRVFAEGGSMGLAFKKLPAPLSGKVELRVRMKLAADAGIENGFLVFGQTPDPATLVQCGLRAIMKKAIVGQGSIGGAAAQSQEADIDSDKVQEIVVSVDLDSGEVTMTTGETTVRTKLSQPLENISYVGYGVMSAVTDFSVVEVSAR